MIPRKTKTKRSWWILRFPNRLSRWKCATTGTELQLTDIGVLQLFVLLLWQLPLICTLAVVRMIISNNSSETGFAGFRSSLNSSPSSDVCSPTKCLTFSASIDCYSQLHSTTLSSSSQNCLVQQQINVSWQSDSWNALPNIVMKSNPFAFSIHTYSHFILVMVLKIVHDAQKIVSLIAKIIAKL